MRNDILGCHCLVYFKDTGYQSGIIVKQYDVEPYVDVYCFHSQKVFTRIEVCQLHKVGKHVIPEKFD
jgi:hypothetical protein